jgi:hypothetical protein
MQTRIGFKKTALALVLASTLGSTLTACSGSSGSNSTPAKNLAISGFAVKGLLVNATITAYSLDKTLVLATVQTTADGSYVLPDIDHVGAILVELTTNANTTTVCDSAIGCAIGDSGNTASFGDSYAFNDPDFILSAVLPDAKLAKQQKLMVTPITHLAAKRIAETGVTSASDIQGSVNATATLLGLSGIDINALAPVDITDSEAVANATGDAQLYGAMVGAIATLAEKNTGASVADVLEILADDFSADGGLSGHSDDASKITLDSIFDAAAEVVTASEAKAVVDQVSLDLSGAATILATEDQAANAVAADAEIAPEVIPVEPEDPTSDAALLTALLNDVSTWDAAFDAASDKGIYQPFENQLEATQDIVDAVSEQSKLVTSAEAFFIKKPNTADEENESGPLLNSAQVIVDGIELAAFIERHYRLAGTAPTAQLSLTDAIALGYDGGFVTGSGFGTGFSSEFNSAAEQTVTIQPQFNNAGRMLSADIAFAHAGGTDNSDQASTETAELTFTVARDEGIASASATELEYSVTSIVGINDDDGIRGNIDDMTVIGDGGKVVLGFANASALQSFIGAVENDLAISLADITALDFNVDIGMSTGSAGDVADTERVEFAMDISFAKAQGVDAASTLEVSFGIEAENTASNESISGTYELEFGGNLTEEVSEFDASDFTHELVLNAYTMAFNGQVTATADDDSSIEFNGSITSDFDLLPISNEESGEDADDFDQRLNSASTSYNGSIVLTDANQYSTSFAGSMSAILDTLKTADGSNLVLAGKSQIEVSNLTLLGTLSTQTEEGNASVELNAATAFDRSNMVFTDLNFPAPNDRFADINYSFSEITSSVLFEGQAAQPSSLIMTADIATSLNAEIANLNSQLDGLNAELAYPLVDDGIITAEISLDNCRSFSTTKYCYLTVNGVSKGSKLVSAENTLLSALNQYWVQNYDLPNNMFSPFINVNSEVNNFIVRRNTYDLINFTSFQDQQAEMTADYDDLEMDLSIFEDETHFPKMTTTLQMDTRLAGIDDGQIKLTATNTGQEDFVGSVFLRYGDRSIKLDVDSKDLSASNSSFVTISNGNISMKIVATCATDRNDDGIHDNEGIAACSEELNFSGDIYVNDSTEKVAVIEDRDGLVVIKFVAGNSLGVVMTPNFDIVRQ